MSKTSIEMREDRKMEFVALAERYVGATRRRSFKQQETIAREIRALRLNNCADDLPEDLSDRLAAAGVSGGAFCGYEGSVGSGAFTIAQVARLITRWHS